MAIKRFFRVMLATVLLCVLPSIVFANPLVVFFGDSVTHNWGKYRDPFFSTNNFLCKGIDDETTGDMLKRYASDVIGQHPQVVVILAGANDIAQNNGVFVTAEQISSNIFYMAKMAQEVGIKVVLCSVLPSSGYNWNTNAEPANFISQLNTIVKKYTPFAAVALISLSATHNFAVKSVVVSGAQAAKPKNNAIIIRYFFIIKIFWGYNYLLSIGSRIGIIACSIM